MKIDANLASFVLAFVGAVSGWITWWINKLKFERQSTTQQAVAAAEKALNDKRDFNHLVNNQIQISDGIAHGFKDLEEMLDDLIKELLEIKAYLIRYGIAPDQMPRKRGNQE
ncbi:MAG: hypothetical protein RM368_29600 [Nostoc sp. DedSLP03]|uniref:hypothetical protein n=1 Tax=Nostoc sp. DedSLP03 TaxID=3075400 RepID=UPI002AD2FDBF|nr:hypothetical protein [Nostoc sp. DedSLP03]MDZ7969060.1 hypothetical protein [Nostoc sp. DedSLP03]